MTSNYRLEVICCALSAFIGVVVYWPVFSYGFVNWDDPKYVTDNVVFLNSAFINQVQWALFSPINGMWHPVTSISLLLDYYIAGLQPGYYHITNLIIHAANCALLFCLLVEMLLPASTAMFIACVFAVHPAHVETVAWISERKGLLGAFFGIGTMLVYCQYMRHKRRDLFVLSNVLFVLGLMAKPFLITLPCLLVVFDFWPLKRAMFGCESTFARLRIMGTLMCEKRWFWSASLFAGIICIITQRAEGTIFELPVEYRVANVLESYWHYVQSSLLPWNLSALYLRPSHWEPMHVGFCIAILVILTCAMFRLRFREPFLLFGWLWYLIMLVPNCGIVPNGPHCYADRYAYLPSVGLSMCAVSAISHLRLPNKILAVAAVGMIVGLSLCSRLQLKTWAASERLWENVLKLDNGNFVAHNNLGCAYAKLGFHNAATREFSLAVAIRPEYDNAYANLALMRYRESDLDSVKRVLKRGICFCPQSLSLLETYCQYLAGVHDMAALTNHYEYCIRVAPHHAKFIADYCRLLLSIGNSTHALSLATKACSETQYRNVEYLELLGDATAENKLFTQAIWYWRRCLGNDVTPIAEEKVRRRILKKIADNIT